MVGDRRLPIPWPRHHPRHNQALDPVHHAGEAANADRAAPVVDHQRDVLQVQVADQQGQIRGVMNVDHLEVGLVR